MPENIDLRIKTDDRPLYAQAVDTLRSLIIREFQPGDRLPSEPELGQQLGVSRTTLRVAMGYLEQQGMITRRHGVGTFVSSPSPAAVSGGLQFLQTIQELAKSANITAVASDLIITEVLASKETAGILTIDVGEPLNEIQYKISIKDLPVAYINTLAPSDVVSAEELIKSGETVLEYLIKINNLGVAYTRSKIFAIEADEHLADELKVELNKALLHLVETYYTSHGDPVALSYNYFVTDRFNFYIGRIFNK